MTGLHQARLAAAGVTARLHGILVLIAQGKTDIEIGRELYLSEHTVGTHVTRLYKALGANDRAHAVAIAYRQGLFLDDPNTKEPSLEEVVADRVAAAVKTLLYDDVREELRAARERLDEVLMAVRRIA